MPPRLSVAFDANLARAPVVDWTADALAPRSVVRTRPYGGKTAKPTIMAPPNFYAKRDVNWLQAHKRAASKGLAIDDLIAAYVGAGPPRENAPIDEIAATMHLQVRAKLEIHEAWMHIAAMPAALGLHPRTALLDSMQ